MTNTREIHLLSHSEVLMLTTSSASSSCSNDGGQKIRGSMAAFSPPSLPWLTCLSCRRLGPSGNYKGTGSFFGFSGISVVAEGKNGHTPLSLGAKEGRKRFSVLS